MEPAHRSIPVVNQASNHGQPHRATARISFASRGFLSSNGSRGLVGQSRGGSRRRQPSATAISILFSLTRTLAKITRSRGAKWGATADSFQATLSHCQPPSTQLDPTSGDVRPPPGTHRRCLLSSGSRVRILPGARGFMAPELDFVQLPCQMPSLARRAQRGQPCRPHRQASAVGLRMNAGRSAARVLLWPIRSINSRMYTSASSSRSRRLRCSASSGLIRSGKGTVRRPALHLAGPKADPPPSCSMSCRSIRIVQVSRSMSRGRSAAGSAHRRLANVPRSTRARYRWSIASARA
jgi:hypothetical protein